MRLRATLLSHPFMSRGDTALDCPVVISLKFCFSGHGAARKAAEYVLHTTQATWPLKDFLAFTVPRQTAPRCGNIARLRELASLRAWRRNNPVTKRMQDKLLAIG